jgi:hypothetical protein
LKVFTAVTAYSSKVYYNSQYAHEFVKSASEGVAATARRYSGAA